MFTDARIRVAMAAMIESIDVPPVSMSRIQRKIAEPQTAAPQTSLSLQLALAAAAAVAVVVLAFPSVSLGVVQSVEAQIISTLRWTPPPPAPRSVESALRTQAGSLAVAQSRVRFTIVPPAGLPKDVTSVKITTTPTGLYTKATNSWRVGAPFVGFTYDRSGRRSFTIIASALDSQDGPPSKYMFEDKGQASDGHEILVRHSRFAWRTGNQIMTAIEGEGVSAAEIVAIRDAMGGVPIPGVWPPDHSGTARQYSLP
jgi:hypothetical protein